MRFITYRTEGLTAARRYWSVGPLQGGFSLGRKNVLWLRYKKWNCKFCYEIRWLRLGSRCRNFVNLVTDIWVSGKASNFLYQLS
jgi:hypothetical protein